MTEPGHEPRNAIEHAAGVALDAFREALPMGVSTDHKDAHVILLAHVPGLDPSAVIAGADGEASDLLFELLVHTRAVARSLGMHLEVVPIDAIGHG